MTDDAFKVLGEPVAGGVLIVSDHASNRVPEGVDLGIDPALLDLHVAIDIGVAQVAQAMIGPGIAAFLGNVSRLVCDFNREEDAPGVVPAASDGHTIPGNPSEVREDRLARWHRPYHAALGRLLAETPPALIVSLHSFTPVLASKPEVRRPWQVGILYNGDDRAARLAMPLFEARGLAVGDQQPYSGKLLNATMNRHAEAHGRAYLGLELRQDEIADLVGQQEWAARLIEVCSAIASAMTGGR